MFHFHGFQHHQLRIGLDGLPDLNQYPHDAAVHRCGQAALGRVAGVHVAVVVRPGAQQKIPDPEPQAPRWPGHPQGLLADPALGLGFAIEGLATGLLQDAALDGGYPVVIAKKGYGTVMATFPRRKGEGKGAEIIAMTGGMATNQIPSASVATLVSDKPAELAASLQQAGAEYAKNNGGDFDVSAKVVGKEVKLTVTGVSAHSSEPESGINPVARMLELIHSVDGKIALKHNHITDAARYASDNWGLDYLGGKLGVGFADDFMGPLTTSLTFVGLDDKAFKLAVNLRVPKGKSPETLKKEIADKLSAWDKQTKVKVSFTYSVAEPMYRNPEGEWVKAAEGPVPMAPLALAKSSHWMNSAWSLVAANHFSVKGVFSDRKSVV